MNPNTPLLTDLYQLTMAAGYWQSGKADEEAVFHLFFRKLPFAGGYAIAAGLADVVAWLEGFHFRADEIDYLATLAGPDGKPLFGQGFLQHLAEMNWRCDVDAIPEGTAVFPHEPLIRVRGPLIQAQLVETALLNLVNFQTLIATKAARICQAAQEDPVLEFGLRRAQGPNGAVMASRAAFIGGCAATSNVLAGMQLGIPVRGTHAHSWVMSFDSELEAFESYAEALPNNCVFLVDTYDTLEGVKNAVHVAKELRNRGHEILGIRLDSGDLASLSTQARAILDEAGFPEAAIVASNDLDEHAIETLKQNGATIGVWGVGTQLVTGGDQPALGGVYKLGALRKNGGNWEPKIKLSEQAIKVSNPGIQQVRRFSREGEFCGDAIFDEESGCPTPTEVMSGNQGYTIPIETTHEDLLQPLYRGGRLVAELPTLQAIQSRCRSQLDQLQHATRRLHDPQAYPTGVEKTLHQRKLTLIQQAKQK